MELPYLIAKSEKDTTIKKNQAPISLTNMDVRNRKATADIRKLAGALSQALKLSC